jgi:hypothetical protein
MSQPGRVLAFSLALELGCPNVDVMLASMPASMFAEWEAFLEMKAEAEKKAMQGGKK